MCIQIKNNGIFFIVILTSLFVVLAACGNTTDKTSGELNEQSQTQNSNKIQNNEPPNNDSAGTDNSDTNVKVDSSNNDVDITSTNHPDSLKAEYLEKLNATKKEIVEMRENPIDDTTFASKKVEGDIYDLLDDLINEIYEELIEQLPSEEMDQLRKEQREWLTYREQSAKEASLKYKNGTMEQLEYVTVENNLTEERCFELVEVYMN
ncbi:lysozyme inhibitor LprI family protein [Bacillus sp. ISL-35]|uniref:lysozyme inhibitor LprI family protein n=1 Tax=Bacillus sp. ISL-35 TaxID=2819122 RepID=UPI001C1B4C16|nr:lysozyme inhibitor LprI family protein [Bacillus sp. ISL-35]MBT2703315.1 DUF1311 domain-containing protein [Chryseobacterium sp. ISL-80]